MEESNYLIDHNGLFAKFKKFPFLGDIDEKFLNQILKLSKMRKYFAGEVVTREGEYDSYIYIIITGQIRVMKHGEQIASMRKQGDTFGELAIIDGETRSATIIADVDSMLLAIDAAFIDRIKPQESKNEFCAVFYKYLLEILASRLRQTGKALVKEKEEITRIKLKDKIDSLVA